jgi:hypothetical protein
MGIVLVAFIAAWTRWLPGHQKHINREPKQLGCKLGGPIGFPRRISVLNGYVLSFFVSTLAQRQPNSFDTAGLNSCIGI